MADDGGVDAAGVTPSAGICGACGDRVERPDAAGLCGGCRIAFYCSTACQRAHWKASHKRECKEIQKRRDAPAPGVSPVGLPPFAVSLAAARRGDAGAQYNVGLAYASGTGVAQLAAAAFEWYTRSAAAASPPPVVWSQLGSCYRFGRGVAADHAEAVRLFRVGAAAGDARAQFNLAQCLVSGIGVPGADFDGAFAHFAAAAAQEYPDAICSLAACYADGRGAARDTPRAIAMWERVVARPSGAAPSTVAAAAFNIGAAYWNGDGGVPHDVERAARYLRQAAALGHETAARVLRENGLV